MKCWCLGFVFKTTQHDTLWENTVEDMQNKCFLMSIFYLFIYIYRYIYINQWLQHELQLHHVLIHNVGWDTWIYKTILERFLMPPEELNTVIVACCQTQKRHGRRHVPQRNREKPCCLFLCFPNFQGNQTDLIVCKTSVAINRLQRVCFFFT